MGEYEGLVPIKLNQGNYITNKSMHALRIKFSKNKVDFVSYLLKEVKTLNIFKIIIFQTLIFRFKTKDQLNLTNFSHKFQSIAH